MTKFFRDIRNSLLMGNKTSNHKIEPEAGVGWPGSYFPNTITHLTIQELKNRNK